MLRCVVAFLCVVSCLCFVLLCCVISFCLKTKNIVMCVVDVLFLPLLIDNRRSGIGSSSPGRLGGFEDCRFLKLFEMLKIPLYVVPKCFALSKVSHAFDKVLICPFDCVLHAFANVRAMKMRDPSFYFPLILVYYGCKPKARIAEMLKF